MDWLSNFLSICAGWSPSLIGCADAIFMAVLWHEKLSWFGFFSQYFPSDNYCNLLLAYEFFQCLQPCSPSWNGYLSERDFDPSSSDLLFSVVCLFLTFFDAHSPSISCNFNTLQSCLFCLSMRANIANFMSSNSLFFTLCDACKQSYLLLIIWCSLIAVFQATIAGEGECNQDRAKTASQQIPTKQETTFIAIVAVLGVSFFIYSSLLSVWLLMLCWSVQSWPAFFTMLTH